MNILFYQPPKSFIPEEFGLSGIKPRYIPKHHLIDKPENFEIALANIAKAGKNIDSSEHIFLRYILDAPFMVLSATIPAHHNDDWMQYLPPPQILSPQPHSCPRRNDPVRRDQSRCYHDYNVRGGPTPATFLLLADFTNF